MVCTAIKAIQCWHYLKSAPGWYGYKSISTSVQYVTLLKYFSHPSLVMYSFAKKTGSELNNRPTLGWYQAQARPISNPGLNSLTQLVKAKMRGCEVVGLILGLKWVQSASTERDTPHHTFSGRKSKLGFYSQRRTQLGCPKTKIDKYHAI